ncbi:hypothetical protein DVH24_022068 [Malus domestica]|uniref:Uncharacterized protein n=1 Tax=Malus domestica TaxID=3750 RepID=A0A498IWU3_MALDO|nr:hypothetical protein DVH24_022068 [Malus domestica]
MFEISGRIPCPHPVVYGCRGRCIGTSKLGLHFPMVDGDSKKFEGKWNVRCGRGLNFPAIFMERMIRSDLPVNLRAMACRFEKNSLGDQKNFKVAYEIT